MIKEINQLIVKLPTSLSKIMSCFIKCKKQWESNGNFLVQVKISKTKDTSNKCRYLSHLFHLSNQSRQFLKFICIAANYRNNLQTQNFIKPNVIAIFKRFWFYYSIHPITGKKSGNRYHKSYVISEMHI